MFKFLAGTVTGVSLTFVAAFGFALYVRSEAGQIARCEALYADSLNEARTNPEVQEKMKEEGFTTVEEMLHDRCSYWVKNGQRF